MPDCWRVQRDLAARTFSMLRHPERYRSRATATFENVIRAREITAGCCSSGQTKK
jgi:hypothetical protein